MKSKDILSVGYHQMNREYSRTEFPFSETNYKKPLNFTYIRGFYYVRSCIMGTDQQFVFSGCSQADRRKTADSVKAARWRDTDAGECSSFEFT